MNFTCRITMEGGGLRRFNKIGAYYRITSLVRNTFVYQIICLMRDFDNMVLF